MAQRLQQVHTAPHGKAHAESEEVRRWSQADPLQQATQLARALDNTEGLLRSKGSTPLDFSTLLLHQLGKVLVERVQFLQNLRRASAPCLAVIEPECSVMAVSGKTEDSRTHLQKEACLREN